ncbi:unnamed protein product [Didymodactylos carnosus]|uniref:Uncharacterized protein n=1 Tax=Didymodactylos carnosus TaxID=1234261 RepID=A0A814UC49_9BILA|nr:unnamed protein product [Didymodactylos carnosus]CAF3938561.1 unnamed protein product [Didymodactylos carnosus]
MHHYLNRLSYWLIDCYRRKRKGDCQSYEFQKAALRAPLVEKTSPISPTVRPAFHRSTQHPSTTLRHLERQILGNSNGHSTDKTDLLPRQSFSPTLDHGLSEEIPLSRYRRDVVNHSKPIRTSRSYDPNYSRRLPSINETDFTSDESESPVNKTKDYLPRKESNNTKTTTRLTSSSPTMKATLSLIPTVSSSSRNKKDTNHSSSGHAIADSPEMEFKMKNYDFPPRTSKIIIPDLDTDIIQNDKRYSARTNDFLYNSSRIIDNQYQADSLLNNLQRFKRTNDDRRFGSIVRASPLRLS